MTIARGSKGQLSYLPESVAGVFAGGDLLNLEMSGDGLKLDRQTYESAMIRSDRNVNFLSYGASSTSGNIDSEIIFGLYDAFLEGAFSGTWSNLVELSFTSDHAKSKGDTITLLGTDDYAGDWYVYRVTDTDKLIIEIATGQTLSDANLAGNDVTAADDFGSILKNGVITKTYSIERKLTDIDQVFLYLGMGVNTASFNVNPGSVLTYKFDFLGQSEKAGVDGAGAGEVYENLNAKTGYANIAGVGAGVMDSFSGVMKEGGSQIAVVSGFDFSIANNLKQLYAVGAKNAIATIDGRCIITGNMSSYIEDLTLYNKYVKGLESSMEIELEEEASGTTLNNAYVLNFPRIKYTGAAANIAGEEEITNSMPFQALYSSDVGCTMYIIKQNAQS